MCLEFIKLEIIWLDKIVFYSWVKTSALASMHWRNVKELIARQTFDTNILVFFLKTKQKIPHTGDKASLDQCG